MTDIAPRIETPSALEKFAGNRTLALIILAGIASAFAFAFTSHFTGESLSDFSLFYRTSGLFAGGDWLTPYYAEAFRALQHRWFGDGVFFPWTYPPPFALLIAPLNAMPPTWAYALFLGVPLALLLFLLHRLEPGHYVLTLLLIFPSLAINLSAGQNGFITASLIAAWAVLAIGNRAWAGWPLGLMIIKPHLAVTAGLWTLWRGGWRMSLWAAIAASGLCMIALLVMGPAVWPAFVQAAKDASHFLHGDNYQLNRMISAYATFRGLGAGGNLAMIMHALCALIILGLNATLLNPGTPQRAAIGFAALSAVAISPYAYDYDLPVVAVGMAILLPALLRHATRLEWYALLPGISLVQLWGLQTTQWL
ncbi:MAG: glycosyltransferase family 87 protein, partial [Beijerinckiaceae bacterium]